MRTTLLLNATYEPLAVVPLKRAVILVLANKAVVVESDDTELRSERASIPVPRVIRLVSFVKVPYQRKIAYSRKAVLERDRHRCGYCGGRASTVDHIVPRSRGGHPRSFLNTVACCGRCNNRKDNRLLSELGWTLRITPTEPTVVGWLFVAVAVRDPSWEPYLSQYADA